MQLPQSFTLKYDFFNPKDTLTCGQIFRYEKERESWFVFSEKEIARIDKSREDFLVTCSNAEYFKNFFDAETDYSSLQKAVSVNEFMTQAAAFGKGIRLLRQPHFEMLISFILSANNNILRIQGILNKLCEALGEKRDFCGKTYFTFPEPQILANQDLQFFIGIGAGYRAKSVLEAAKRVAEGFDLNEIEKLPLPTAKEKLLSFHGVGEKVCDCILLFSYNRQEVFPVDTWLEKVYCEHFDLCKRNRTQISTYFTSLFGNHSGYAQQVLFYYKRSGRV